MFEEIKKEKIEQLQISTLREEDIEFLDVILKEYIKDSETGKILEAEISEIENYMRGKEDNERKAKRLYLVAKNENGEVLGCIGYSKPDLDMIKHFKKILKLNDAEMAEKCAELLNVFTRSEKNKGVGRKLFDAACEAVKVRGKDYLLINSGPRYRNSWGFYDKMGAIRSGFIIDKYGKGRDAMAWVKNLN